MEIPAGDRGSLRKLARSMEVVSRDAPDGTPAEYLEFEVSS